MSMAAVGPFARTSPRPRVDGVVFALTRLIATARETYREELVSILYQYRRREGLFTAKEHPIPYKRHPKRTIPHWRSRPIPLTGVGSPDVGFSQRPGPALPVRGEQAPGRVPNPREVGRRYPS